MSYATVAQVKSYFLGMNFDANSDISESDVQFHLDNEEQHIDSQLSSVYQVPITDTDDVKKIRKIHAELVAGTIDDMFNYASEREGAEQNRKRRNLRKQAEQDLQNLVNRKTYLKNSISETVVGRGKEDLQYENLPICQSDETENLAGCEDC